MTEAAKNLRTQARKLSPAERLWAKEAEDRLAAYRRGELKAIPLQEVLAKYCVA